MQSEKVECFRLLFFVIINILSQNLPFFKWIMKKIQQVFNNLWLNKIPVAHSNKDFFVHFFKKIIRIICERYHKKIDLLRRSQAEILSVQCTDKIAFGLSSPVPPQIAIGSPKEEKIAMIQRYLVNAPIHQGSFGCQCWVFLLCRSDCGSMPWCSYHVR